MMLKVLVVSHMFPRAHHKVGGIFVLEQVKALRDNGIDARVISGDPFWANKFPLTGIVAYARAHSKVEARWTEYEGVPVMFFPYLAGGVFRPWLHAWTYEIGLLSILSAVKQQFDYDLVHAHTSYLDGNAGVRAARLGNVPLVITEHTGPFSLLANHVLKRIVTRRAVNAAQRVLCVGDSLRADMRKELSLPNAHIDVLSNGYDHHTFRMKDHSDNRSNGIRALWVGHFVPVKRIDRLVEAFSRIAADIPELTLSLMGDGEGLEAAKHDVEKRGLSERILFLKASDRGGVSSAMREHDFLVVSSEVETFSLVTIEAFASGLPVLSTRCGGPEDLIADQGLGRLVTNDIEGIAAGLEDMCRNIKDFDSAHIATRAASGYSWDSVAKELKGIYRELLENNRFRAQAVDTVEASRSTGGKR